MPSLAEMREKLLQKQKEEQQGGNDSVSYRFWDIPLNETATVRFLPDGNENNDFFWVENQVIRIPFTGVLGGDELSPVMVTVPCVRMWGMECPILQEVGPWFNSEETKDMARKYWKRHVYVFQGFVVKSPFEEKNPPNNPIRRFVFDANLYNVISSGLLGNRFEDDELPIDYNKGTDFNITKSPDNKYDFSSSEWVEKSRALNQLELEAIEEHGLNDLSNFRPKKPNDEQIRMIMKLFESSVEGELYDLNKFGNYYRPQGLQAPSKSDNKSSNNTGSVKQESVNRPTPSESTQQSPVQNTAPPTNNGGGKSAADILAEIRARRGNS